MSFVITVYVREGIVMAADSRLTLTTQLQQQNLIPMQISVPSTDSNQKVFVSTTGIGISTFGDAGVGTAPIGDVIERFLREQVTDASLGPEDVARSLLAHLASSPTPPNCQLHVAGYKTEGASRVQQVWNVGVAANAVNRANPNNTYGAIWGGEAETMSRLFGQLFRQTTPGQFEPLPTTVLAWEWFTFQDAIDFSTFAVRATTNFIRFLPRPQTVGGPIDVLLIRPNGHRWLNKKQLHMS